MYIYHDDDMCNFAPTLQAHVHLQPNQPSSTRENMLLDKFMDWLPQNVLTKARI